MKNFLKKILHSFFFWIFKDEIDDLHLYITANKKISRRLHNMLDSLDVSVILKYIPNVSAN